MMFCIVFLLLLLSVSDFQKAVRHPRIFVSLSFLSLSLFKSGLKEHLPRALRVGLFLPSSFGGSNAKPLYIVVVVSFASVNEKLDGEDFENVHFLVSMHDTQNKERREERETRETQKAPSSSSGGSLNARMCYVYVYIYVCVCIHTQRVKTPKESQRTPQINPKCTSPHPYHSIIWYSGVCFMDSTPRYVWVEKGGTRKELNNVSSD